MDENKKFELSDDALDDVAGGLLLQDEATDGRTTTQVTTRVCCTKCGTNKGWLFAWPDGRAVIYCSNPHGKHVEGDIFDFARILVQSPTSSDYTPGW